MRDIKERVRDKNPKIRNPAARLPKELVRSAVLEAKEKPRELHEKSSGQSDSPTQYGTEKIESVQYRAASVAGRTIGKTTYRGGKKLAGVTYRKIKERKSRQEEAKAAEEAMEQGAESGKKLIKLKPEQAALAKENGKRQVKAAPRVVKVSGLSQEKIKTQASMQKQQVEKSLQAMQKARVVQMARKSAQASAESGKAVFQVTGKGSKLSVQGITAAIQKGVVALEKMGKWIAAGGGAFLLVFILIVGIIAGAAFSSSSESSESLSDEVLAYTSVIQQYASQYGIPEYVSAIQAIMMQESGGRGTDPMQCSESPYNTRFPHTPGSITDPDYSIEVGVQTFADCISQAGCSSPQDMDKLKLAWQGYNYGNGYIGIAKRRLYRSQCIAVFTGTGSFAWMEQLRRSPIRSPCDAVLFRWQPVCWFVWKSADCLGGNGAAWKQRRSEVLELVWIRQSGRMVCLFCKLVCGSERSDCKWECS